MHCKVPPLWWQRLKCLSTAPQIKGPDDDEHLNLYYCINRALLFDFGSQGAPEKCKGTPTS